MIWPVGRSVDAAGIDFMGMSLSPPFRGETTVTGMNEDRFRAAVDTREKLRQIHGEGGAGVHLCRSICERMTFRASWRPRFEVRKVMTAENTPSAAA